MRGRQSALLGKGMKRTHEILLLFDIPPRHLWYCPMLQWFGDSSTSWHLRVFPDITDSASLVLYVATIHCIRYCFAIP